MDKEIRERDFSNKWLAFAHYGSMEALSSIYYIQFDILYDYGKKFTSDEYIIEDAIQNIFINLIKYKDSLKNVKNVRGYLMIAFRNELMRLLMSKRNFENDDLASDSDFLAEYEEDSEEDDAQFYMKKKLQCCLKDLSPKQREMLFLRFDAGLSYEEISQAINISIESCRTSVYRTIKNIKNLLKPGDTK